MQSVPKCFEIGDFHNSIRNLRLLNVPPTALLVRQAPLRTQAPPDHVSPANLQTRLLNLLYKKTSWPPKTQDRARISSPSLRRSARPSTVQSNHFPQYEFHTHKVVRTVEALLLRQRSCAVRSQEARSQIPQEASFACDQAAVVVSLLRLRDAPCRSAWTLTTALLARLSSADSCAGTATRATLTTTWRYVPSPPAICFVGSWCCGKRAATVFLCT